MELKFTRIILFVMDVPNTAKFYIDSFGLKSMDAVNNEWMELDAGGCNIALHKASGSINKVDDSKVKIVFGAKDVGGTKSALEKKGIVMGKTFTFEGMQFCDGRDPEGNRFQISDRGLK